MGRYYALGSGEVADVADAIADHYSPVGPNDNCPSKPASVAVALADKIDTLVGFWAIDEKPTGSKDPFALRRAALGVIRLIIENNLRLSLVDVFATAGGKDVTSDLLSFFADRLKVHLKDKGVRHDLIDAVFALGEDDLVVVLARVDALGEFLSCDDGANLLVAYTRAANILKIEEKKDGKSYTGNPDPVLLEEAGEKALFKKLREIGPKITAFISDEKYTEIMKELANACPEIDAFFDKVTVNADQPELRENRLNMLSYIRQALDEVADFSKIEI
jgi:glycyl-tRNA synthetase beta chain